MKLLKEMIILFALCGNYQIEEEQLGNSYVIIYTGFNF